MVSRPVRRMSEQRVVDRRFSILRCVWESGTVAKPLFVVCMSVYSSVCFGWAAGAGWSGDLLPAPSSPSCPEYEFPRVLICLFSLYRRSNLRILMFRICPRVLLARVHVYSRLYILISTSILRLFSESLNLNIIEHFCFQKRQPARICFMFDVRLELFHDLHRNNTWVCTLDRCRGRPLPVCQDRSVGHPFWTKMVPFWIIVFLAGY